MRNEPPTNWRAVGREIRADYPNLKNQMVAKTDLMTDMDGELASYIVQCISAYQPSNSSATAENITAEITEALAAKFPTVKVDRRQPAPYLFVFDIGDIQISVENMKA